MYYKLVTSLKYVIKLSETIKNRRAKIIYLERGIHMSYISGKVIRELREKKQLTQKQLADILRVSDKTISKWETERGLPDISLISPLASALSVSVAEILVGEYAVNDNRSANMKKGHFYVCPVCGNVIWATGKASYNCCGIQLPEADIEEPDERHNLQAEIIENEYYVHMNHLMAKEHYISFIAYVTSNHAEIVKLYPEQEVECRFLRRGHGDIYAYCNRHGLFRLTM